MKLDDQTNLYLVNPINTGMQDWDQTNISVIIPAYNCHNTIVQTLASIAMQENIHEIETIIADDCSDYPYDEIAEIFSKFMKIKVVRLKKGGGPGTARQVGFDHSVGKYVTFMDGDDSLIGCDALNTLKRVMIEREQDCVYGQFLEQSENGELLTHEIHMVWMFGKLYRRSFLEHYNIRMNMSHSNEDTGYNCVVKGCSTKVWYIPKPVYTWRFKPNSITRFNNGMYGSESGMCGYLTNMIWQIKELEKRFVNKNYILQETIAIMCTLYHFYIENMQRYPLGTDANMEWIRYYYEQCYKPYEHLIDEGTLNQIFAQVAAGQNIAGKGIIPKITFFDFMKEMKSRPYTHDPMHDVGGSVIEIPQTTPENYPVEVHEYMNNLMVMPKMNTNTNLARMDGMQRILDMDKQQRKNFLEQEVIPKVKKETSENVSVLTRTPWEDVAPPPEIPNHDASKNNTHTDPSILEGTTGTTGLKKCHTMNDLTDTEYEWLQYLRGNRAFPPCEPVPCGKFPENPFKDGPSDWPMGTQPYCGDSEACTATYKPNPNEIITVTGNKSDYDIASGDAVNTTSTTEDSSTACTGSTKTTELPKYEV